MNTLLELKKTFDSKKHPGGTGGANLPPGKTIYVSHLVGLRQELQELKDYWEQESEYFDGILVQVLYTKIVAKSNRLSTIFNGSKSIVGARFTDDTNKRHIITHYTSLTLLQNAIELYDSTIKILTDKYGGALSHQLIGEIKKGVFSESLPKTKFIQILVDSYYVERFYLDTNVEELAESALVTIYETDTSTEEIMRKIGIKNIANRTLDSTTLRLTPDEIKLLKLKAPYLIAMATSDISFLSKEDFENTDSDDIMTIPSPSNEPIIGVIDTLFDKNVYFSEWVEFTNMVDPAFEIKAKDYEHGTAVSSIIVDGVTSNPHLDDGCGRFRVRHFGVAISDKFSSFTILKHIEEIILKNKDIKVWNLCLGAMKEVHPNFISPEAYFLDKIQHENDIIFVIAATNKALQEEDTYIGSPADSINSVVVSAVDKNNNHASYSRKGPVLSFFTKPDVACFGGDTGGTDGKIRVCLPTGEAFVTGTSYAAPWVARKLAYMIHVLGLSREIAKALLLHSALSWGDSESDARYVGHGILPKHIDKIVQSTDDEIRFVVLGTSKDYYTYDYTLPIPFEKEKHPFIAKATMCYFPACSRKQGVDYTNTEFEFSFGRIKDISDGSNKLESISKKKYSTGENYLYEKDARSLYRKWDNVKNLLEVYTGRNRSKKMYSNPNWGIQVTAKERLNIKHGRGLNFGIVITLKEINGKNRIEDFIQQCQLRGWIVNRIDVQNRIDIHNLAEEEINFSDI